MTRSLPRIVGALGLAVALLAQSVAPPALAATVPPTPSSKLRTSGVQFMGLGDSRIYRGLTVGANSVIKDRGFATDGLQFWLQSYSKGRVTFDEPNEFAVSGSTTRSSPGCTPGTVACQGLVDYQLPLALKAKARNALLLSSTNDRFGTSFTAAQSIANLRDTITGLCRSGVTTFVVAEYPKGTPGYSPAYAIDYGISQAVYSAPGTGHAVGDIITLTRSGLTPQDGRNPQVQVRHISSGGAYSVTVVDPGSYAASLSSTTTNWTQLATTGAGTGYIATITGAGGSYTQQHYRVRDWILNTAPTLCDNVYAIDVWPELQDSVTGSLRQDLTADGVHLNSTGSALVAQKILSVINAVYPPAFAAPSNAFQTYDPATNIYGNLLPPAVSLTAPLQSGTASLFNYTTGSAASPQPTVTGNTPNACIVASGNTNLVNATSPTVTFSRVTTATGDWLQINLTGTTGAGSNGIGGIFSLKLPSALISPCSEKSIYGQLAAGDVIRGTAEFEVDQGATGFLGLGLKVGELNTTTAGYNASWSGLLNSAGAASVQGAYGVPWDPLLATGGMSGLLRTSTIPIVGNAPSPYLYFNLYANLKASSAYSVTFRVRNWALVKVAP